MSLRLFESLATTELLAEVFSDASLLASMLRFEVALARAEARVGVIPVAAADRIADAAVVDAFDPAAIARVARASGTIAIPLVERLTARVRAANPDGATFVHWGATSQDVSDTALVLCLVRARRILVADHERLASALRRLSDQHAGSVMLARTLLQPAPPITFGLKVAGWFGAVSRGGARVDSAFNDACVLQFGGASGTLAALGAHGLTVAEELARELELTNPDAPWHAHRDRLASLAGACGVYTGTLGKIARDVALLMQHEVGEVAEPGGASSTMPHKRNPAGCAIALAAAIRVPGLVSTFLSGMPQEHERGVGGWHAEAATIAAIVQATGAALAALADAIEALSVDAGRMRANIAATRGMVFAERAMTLLAPELGRDVASRLIARALDVTRREGHNFVETLAADAEVAAVLAHADLSSLGTPEAYLGAAEQLRRRLMNIERG
ncbi:MAG: 3-carboxy-cis,cis-muconate cycloisomerase [Luteitalea sp.]|nr:3-carboxy-cis,cis-muconate cycloisomerase [Luteitalea sp.]